MSDAKTKQYKKFQHLPEEFRNAMLSADQVTVDKTIREAAINLVTLEMAKQFDEDLNSLKEQLKTATEVYREGKKANLLKIEFLIEILRSRGVDVPGVEDFIKNAQKEAIS